MEFERGGFEVLFKEIDYAQIRSDSLSPANHNYCHINKDLFVNSALRRFYGYNQEEIENVYSYLEKKGTLNDNKFNIFYLIQIISEELLKWDDDRKAPYCELQNVLKWRDISLQLGQDFFTCALAVKNSVNYYNWSPIVSVSDPDNNLEQLFEKGLSENHFHLGGSTRIFELNWISIMNHILGRDKEFKLFSNKLQNQMNFSINGEVTESLKIKCQKASLFRIYLYAVIKGYSSIAFEAETIVIDVINGANIEFYLSRIQDLIAICSFNNSLVEIDILDYSIPIQSSDKSKKLLSGERYFLVNCYAKSLSVENDKFTEFQRNTFYRYLLIKTLFRSEFVQVNRQVGFTNFQNYQDRKKYFVKKYPKYEKMFYPFAISMSIEKQNILKFEVRICPENTAVELRKKINEFVKSVNKIKKDNLRHKDTDFYMVLHFLKNPDSGFVRGKPRNYNIREQTKHHTQIIKNALSTYSDIGNYVRGIDACSKEIGCRPEVFAEYYRELLDFRFSSIGFNGAINNQYQFNTQEQLFLRATYHVGEDFLDIMDGLRAIDEALLFCGLKKDSRLGHALALGIDAKNYYVLKNMTLALPKQILLDNLVWSIKKCEEFRLNKISVIGDKLIPEIEEIIGKLMSDIYGIDDNKEKHNDNIQVYFESWYLRGDNPSVYFIESQVEKYIEEKEINPIYWYYFNPLIDGIKSRANSKLLRQNRDVISLYHRYHFDKDVRQKGDIITDFKISKTYIYFVTLLQDEMIKFIEEKCICIESNPSSNYLISTINRYDQHPIVRFNSNKLVPPVNRNRLNVSINTDDQGVFDTMLENEYAIMYESIRKAENEDGSKKYNNVIEWLDVIRENGLQQAFD